MTITWDDLVGPAPSAVKAGARPSFHCECGRFAKWVGDRHYYNGNFDCYSYELNCSRCGVITIECV